MHDSGVENQLRAAFRAESEGLPLTISAAELQRRLAARQRTRTGRRVNLLAAAIAIVAVGAIATMSNGWLRLPAIGGTVSPSPDASPSATATPSFGLAPIPATAGRIEVTRIDPTDPTDPVDRTFEGRIQQDYIALHATVSCLGDGTLDFSLDGQTQHVDCSIDGETSVGGTYQAADDILDYRLVTTGRLSYGVLVELQVGSEPPPSGSLESPSGFTPPPMLVAVTTLGEPGETLQLTTGCYAFTLADGESGTTRCLADPSAVTCCATLDVPWGADLTFSIPDGWAIDRALIDTTGQSWVDDRTAPSRTILGWSRLGEEVLTIEGTYSKDGDRFTATYAVPIQGPAAFPGVPTPTTCGTPDLTAPTPPVVTLRREQTQRGDALDAVAGEFGTFSWGTQFSEAPGEPMPADAIQVVGGQDFQLLIDGDVCARGWEIGYGPRGTGEWLSIDQVGSLVPVHRTRPMDPIAFANRFDLADLPIGDWYIEARFQYADGEAAVGWHVIVR